MNEIYAKRHGEPIDNRNESTAMRAVNKLIERDRASRERNEQIINHYRDGQQKGMKM
ncbi:MAG: hypothetical protein K2N34_01895 [Lachnospiraceae bacterium]|nr:hypothetical protein [Lachnospiraceae bacterium]